MFTSDSEIDCPVNTFKGTAFTLLKKFKNKTFNIYGTFPFLERFLTVEKDSLDY